MDRKVGVQCCGGVFWMYVMVIAGLLLFSGLMAGLTLGLMSLGMVDLEVIMKSGNPKDRRYAEKIIPVVRRRHLLLVTLLVGNAIAMEALPLFLDSLVGTWIAIALSVTLLLMFGEILPQAICSRYGLAIGARLSPFVKLLLFVMFPIAWPVSKLLDMILGKQHAGLFSRMQLKTLVDMHCDEAGKGGELSTHETRIIAGVLELAGKSAKTVMTSIDEIFSVDVASLTKMDTKTMLGIFAKGYSRIPVFRSKPSNIVGFLMVKNLLNITIEKGTNVTMLEIPIKKMPRFPEDMPLYDVLEAFRATESQIAAVVRRVSVEDTYPTKVRPAADHDMDASGNAHEHANGGGTIAEKLRSASLEWDIVGIITREDVIQEILRDVDADEVECEIIVSTGDDDIKSRVSSMKSNSSQRPPVFPSTGDQSEKVSSTAQSPLGPGEDSEFRWSNSGPCNSGGGLIVNEDGELPTANILSASAPGSPTRANRNRRRTQSMDDRGSQSVSGCKKDDGRATPLHELPSSLRLAIRGTQSVSSGSAIMMHA